MMMMCRKSSHSPRGKKLFGLKQINSYPFGKCKPNNWLLEQPAAAAVAVARKTIYYNKSCFFPGVP
jgi:hypothetical protein